MPTELERFESQRRLVAIEQAEEMIENHGECYGNWECDQCQLIDFMDDPDDCNMEDALQAAYDLLDHYDENRGRCKSIW